MADNRDVITTGEVAAILGTSRHTALAWAKRGYIPHWKTLSGQRRYSREVVEKLRDQQFDGSLAS